MNIFKKLFCRTFGAKSHRLDTHVDQIQVQRDSQVQIAPVTTFPSPAGINRSLAKLLSKHDNISAAYLVQLTYIDNPDMSPDGRPCLSLCIEYEGGHDKKLHDQISIDAQRALDGMLGEWGFIDIIAGDPDILRAANTATTPFFMKQK
jgi:hypothetical protein